MGVRSVRVKRTVLIDKIDEHIKAILGGYQQSLAQFTKDDAAFATTEAQFKADLAAYYRRAADALDGTSKDKVVINQERHGAYNGWVSLTTSKGVPVNRPVAPTRPQKPANPDNSGSWEGRALDWLRQQKALLSVSIDEVITVGIDDHGILFTSPLGRIRV